MSINQLLITAFLAMLVGILLCMVGTLAFKKLKKYYAQLTFKHEVLEPYKPNRIKKGKQ
ncbi:hypothetical protein PESP_a2759 [Pseudoalteromonas espejiana DSM 9414]|uniref:Uncharacterized protein n=1 Tax=Pseudoalteromonas espejiana TaxID=28107 RepID=A0A510XRZ8_9GAMM|nr:hypothetical protein [Pseudoalteromonas espejiana]ASM50681.1 hypothetical protein PESP_a2759 [Pseudoalteromonas espejiana DSM 9414]GEK53401.1 hypothetical protein PES01_02460 [Pseudoalteromonas espejiana]